MTGLEKERHQRFIKNATVIFYYYYYFQGEDVLQDRFVVHEDQYRSVREGVAKAVISGNIQDIVRAITVRRVCNMSMRFKSLR